MSDINRILLLMLVCAGVGYGTQNTWTGAINSSWKTAGNWSAVFAPRVSDTVIFTSTGNVACTVDSSDTVGFIRIRNGYTATFNTNGYALGSLNGDSIGSGGAVIINGSFYIGSFTSNIFKTSGALTTSAMDLVFGNNTIGFTSAGFTCASVTSNAGAGKTISLVGTITTGALNLTNLGSYNGATIIIPTSCPYTFNGNGAIFAGNNNFTWNPSAACSLAISHYNQTGSATATFENTTSGNVIYSQLDSLNGFGMFITKTSTGRIKYLTNNQSIHLTYQLSVANSNATGDDSVFFGSSYVFIPTLVSGSVAGNTWLMAQTSNWVVGGNITLASKVNLSPGTSSFTLTNTAKATITAGNSTNSLYQVYLRANTGIIDSIAGTLRVTNLQQDSGRFVPGPDSIIFAGNGIFKSKTSADSTRVMTKYTTWKFSNAASCEWGNIAGRLVDSLNIMALNNFTHTLDTAIVNIRQLILPSTAGNVTYTQSAAKTLGYFVNGSMSGAAGDTISYLSSSAGNRTYFQPPSAQAVTYATFKDFASNAFIIYDTAQSGGMDRGNDSNIVFRSTNAEKYNTPNTVTVTSCTPDSGLTTGGYTANLVGTAFFGPCSLWVKSVGTRIAYSPSDSMHINNYLIPASSLGQDTIFVKNVSGSIGKIGFSYVTPVTISSSTPDTTVIESTTVSWQVTASGTAPITYLWYRNNISTGVTTSTYSFTAGYNNNLDSVYCAVTNVVGTVNSTKSHLTVTPLAPRITKQPDDTTVLESTGAKFITKSISAVSSSKLWYKNLASTGITTDTFSITPTYADNGDSFYCAVTNATGTTNSREAHLTVTANPPVITHQPQDTTVKSGTNTSFTVSATGSGSITYLWYRNTVSTGVTTTTYTYSTTDANNGDSVWCVVTNSGGSTTTRHAHLTVLSGWPTPTKAFFWNQDTAYIGKVLARDSLNTGHHPSVNGITADSNALVLHGNARKFDDMGDMDLVTGVTNGSGHGTPTLTNAANGFSYYAFAIGSDSVNCTTEEKHRFVEGDSGHIQFMWRNNGVDGTTRTVKWSIHANVSNPGDSSTYDTTITVQDSIMSTDKSLKYHYNDIADWYVPNSKIGSIWAFQIKRVSVTGTPPSNNPFGVRVGVHKKVDTFGSVGETTK